MLRRLAFVKTAPRVPVLNHVQLGHKQEEYAEGEWNEKSLDFPD